MARFYKDRRRAQAGTTLVELLVSLVIIGLALTLIIGVFSTGLLNATVAKRNTAAQAVIQSELEAIAASPFNATASDRSDCYATESTAQPAPVAYQGTCAAQYSLRADISVALQTPTPTTQTWTVSVVSWPDLVSAGPSVSTVKADR